MIFIERHLQFDFKKGGLLYFRDVSGYTSANVYLRRYEDIHISGLLSPVAIKLLVTEKGLEGFFTGQSIGWLFTYVVSLVRYLAKVCMH